MNTRALILVYCGLATLLIGNSVLADDDDPKIFSPGSEPYGHSYGEWAVKWWQWALGIPEAQNPVADATGAHCAVNQPDGRVWFLAGTFGFSAERSCTIPARKALFLPVFNWIFGAGVFDCAPTVPDVECNVPELQAKAAAATESATALGVWIDGVAVENVQQFRAASPGPFSVTFPPGAVFGIPEGTFSPHVADGYWLMLKPLSPGQHTIQIHVESSVGFGFDLMYNLIVENAPDDDE